MKQFTLTIRHKIWLGFALMIAVIVCINLIGSNSLSQVKYNVNQIVSENQPAMISLLTLKERIESTNASLGFYLVSKSNFDKMQYIDKLKTLDKSFKDIYQFSVIKTNPKYTKILGLVEKDFVKYKSYQKIMLNYASNNAKNYPSLSYSSEHLNPTNRKIKSLMNEMMQSESEEEPSGKRRKIFSSLADLRLTWASMIQTVRAYLAYRGKDDIKNIHNYRDVYKQLLGKIKAYGDDLTFEQTDAVERLAPLTASYFTNLDHSIKIHGSNKWRMDAYTLRAEVSPLVGRIKGNIDTIVSLQRKQLENESKALLTDLDFKTVSLDIIVAVSVILAIIVAWILGAIVTNPIRSTVMAMSDIAEGEGDLTKRLEVKSQDEMGKLSGAFNLFVGKVHEFMYKLTESCGKSANAANEMQVSVGSMTESVAQQQVEIDQVAAAVNEMAMTVQEISSNASLAAEHTSKVDSEAENGKKVVQSTIATINELAKDVEETSNVVLKLEKDTEEIGSVLDVIRGIAEQTNLLALNAAIEAARAGDQGRGFAVVADEVRGLASRTQKSTQEIHETIERLQNRTKEAASVMQKGRAIAKTSVEQAAEAGNSLTSITNAISEITTLNGQIKVATSQQSEVANEINETISRISVAAQDAAADAKMVLKANETMAELVNDTKQQTKVFKT